MSPDQSGVKDLNPSFTRGGGGGRADPPKGFSSITFEQNDLETSNLRNVTLTIYTYGDMIKFRIHSKI